MSFNLGIANLPKNKTLLSDISEACLRLKKKIEDLDISSQEISEYNKKYLNMLVGTPDGLENTLRKYAFVLAWAFQHKNPKDVVFLDYGAGHGLLAFLASELGVKKCILNDIFETSVKDAKVLAHKLSVTVDYFIVGDVNETLDYLKENSLEVDVIANYDTIEHIYDIDYFFSKLKDFGPNVSFFFSSGANGENPFIERKLRKFHLEREYQDRIPEKGHKDSDSLQSYVNIRKNIINENFPDLPEKDTQKLVKATRGKMLDDILKITKEFKSSGQLPKEIPDKTNTCDPMNGNWAEHIMSPFALCKDLESLGFKDTYVLAGYYGKPKKPINKVIGFFLNLFIKATPVKLGLKLSPFYSIAGARQK